jgi:hypothetical protein
MVLNSKILLIIIPSVLFLGIGTSMVSGLWNSGDKTPSRYEDNELNPYDPQSISGSYSFAAISEFFDIPIDVLYDAFSISESFDPDEFKAKHLGSIYEPMAMEVGTEAVQAFVALYNGLPYELIDVYLPKEAVTMVLEHNTAISSDQHAYLLTHTLSVVILDPSKVTLTEDEETDTEFAVKGPTTIQEVLDAGLTKAEFEAIVGKTVTFTNETVKDFCIEKGLSFSEVKIALQDAVNK